MRTLILATVIGFGVIGCPNSPTVTDAAPKPVPCTEAKKANFTAPCPQDATPTPVPVSLDATPKPTPVVDAAPPATDSCTQACAKMMAMGCAQSADCAKVLELVQTNKIIRNPKTTNALTCNDLLKAGTSTDVTANGWNCVVSTKH
jgi:hypothetical protein